MPGKAIVIGASGLIGSCVVEILARKALYDEVLLLVRKTLDIKGHRVRQRLINFDALNDYSSELTGKVIFSCLGTTRSQVADYKEYRKVDFEYPIRIAEVACRQGVEQFHIVSSLGANKNSGNSYLRTKGEVEEALKAMPFKSIHIYRPSFLVGSRSTPRFAERLLTPFMKVINPLLRGPLKKYRSINAAVVANAMINRASADLEGVFIYESDEIQNIK